MSENLREIAAELASQEGLNSSIGGTTQIAEVLALLGLRWRRMGAGRALREAAAIIERAGLQSQHAEQTPVGEDHAA